VRDLLKIQNAEREYYGRAKRYGTIGDLVDHAALSPSVATRFRPDGRDNHGQLILKESDRRFVARVDSVRHRVGRAYYMDETGVLRFADGSVMPGSPEFSAPGQPSSFCRKAIN